MTLSTEATLIVINLIITSFIGLATPLVQSLSFVLKHLKKCESCCGAKWELRTSAIKSDKKNSLV